MKDERLLALIDLQSVITKKYTLFRTHETIPDRLEQLRSEILKAEEKLASAQKAIKENQSYLSRSRKEIEQSEEKMTALQSKLNQVKTTREYESRQKEIKSQRERTVELEKGVGEAEGKLEELQQVVDAATLELENVKERVQPEIDQLEAESVEYEKALGEIMVVEREKREAVPSAILERVDRLVMLRQGMAVVPVGDGCCGGCGVQLSPQTIQVAKRGLDLLQCDRCSSYLYWDEEE
jgi:uncharacterized protein